jgi:probable rRNA maturation factor
MKLILEFNDKAKSGLKKDLLLDVAGKIMGNPEFDHLKNKKITISVAFISEKEIKEINRIYRKKNSVTDVLSFAEYPSARAIRDDRSSEIVLGEIILCYTYIADYCKKRSLPLKEGITSVISHGVLHLLGFKHGKKMFAIQEEAVKKT